MGTSQCSTAGPPYGTLPTCQDGLRITADKNNIVRQVLAAGKSFKSYQESIPAAGFLAEGNAIPSDCPANSLYVPRHDPLVYFSDVRQGLTPTATCTSTPPAQLSCPNASLKGCDVVPSSQLQTDLAHNTLPNFSFVTPNLQNDAHGAPGSGCGSVNCVTAADNWMKNNIPAILNSSYFQPDQDGLLILWFDEGDASDSQCSSGVNGHDPETNNTIACGGRIPVLLIGPGVKAGFEGGAYYQHPSLLRTVMEALGLTALPAKAATAPDMAEFFGSASHPVVTVTSPQSGASVESPVAITANASSGHPITGWHIYLDNTDVFSAGAVTGINANVTMSQGTHTVIVRAWDSTGAFGDQTLTLNVVPPSGVTVTATTPANNASVNSPVPIAANASSPNGITGWHIYVDSADVFSAGAVNSINASIDMSSGTHTVIVRAWDSTGAFGDQTLTLSVVAGVGVSIDTPAPGANVVSPVPIAASATSVHPITGWHIYVDNVDSFSAGQVNQISANLTMTAGTHTVIVRAWDSTGAFGDQTFTVNVVSGVAVNVTSPQNTVTVTSPVNVAANASSNHIITGWHIYVDSADSFSAGEANQISASIPMNTGTHTVIVRAWDSTGVFGDQTLSITVK
jgi:acid phosphatase